MGLAVFSKVVVKMSVGILKLLRPLPCQLRSKLAKELVFHRLHLIGTHVAAEIRVVVHPCDVVVEPIVVFNREENLIVFNVFPAELHEIQHFDLAATPDEDLPEKLLGYLSHYGSYRKKGQTDYMEYEGHGIWGLTARIIVRYVTA